MKHNGKRVQTVMSGTKPKAKKKPQHKRKPKRSVKSVVGRSGY